MSDVSSSVHGGGGPPGGRHGAEGPTGADLRGVHTWLFDLDNTLYPHNPAFMDLIGERMTGFVMRLTGLERTEAHALQERYLDEHGATLAGLTAHYAIDARAFLDEVHDVSLDLLAPDPVLRRALQRLPGRRLVFTNGSAGHAARVLPHLGIDDLFEAVFHLESADLTPKPARAAYEALVRVHDLEPTHCAFFEDSERNLAPAAELGMTTVLVGSGAAASSASFVHHRTTELAGFLTEARVGP